MGQINLSVEDELEREFRRVAADRFGAKKGFMKAAVEEAIRDWIQRHASDTSGSR